MREKINQFYEQEKYAGMLISELYALNAALDPRPANEWNEKFERLLGGMDDLYGVAASEERANMNARETAEFRGLVSQLERHLDNSVVEKAHKE